MQKWNTQDGHACGDINFRTEESVIIAVKAIDGFSCDENLSLV
jgi:hypothetical protein